MRVSPRGGVRGGGSGIFPLPPPAISPQGFSAAVRDMLDAMKWTEWLTLGIALLGAITGTYGVVRQYFKDRPRLLVTGFVQPGFDDRRRLRIKLVNTGHVPVTVDKVFLTGGRAKQPKAWELWEYNHANPKLPYLLQPGEQLVVVTDVRSVVHPAKDEAFTVMARTADGIQFFADRTNRTQLAVEVKTLAWEAEDPTKQDSL